MSISKKLMTTGADTTYVDDMFSTYLYEGTGSAQTITNGIDLDGEGGLVWLKNRDESGVASANLLFDSERGITKYLQSNTNSPQSTDAGYHISSFNSDGFSLQNGGGGSNKAGIDFASWTFRKAPGFFDVVTYTGTATSPTDTSQYQDIPHNLGTTPGMIIVKKLDSINGLQNWIVNHRAFDGSSKFIRLDTNNIPSNSDKYFGTNLGFGDHSETFRVVCDDAVNLSGSKYVAYLFAHDDSDESMIKCGSYTGNGSNDGPEIDLGFEPQWILQKRTDVSDDWHIFDNMRGIVSGGLDKYLRPNGTDDENQNTWLELTSTGFKLTSGQSNVNASGGNYIYMAIRRPNKPAKEFEPEELFNTGVGISDDPTFQTGFVTDMGMETIVSSSYSNLIFSRLTGTAYLHTDSSGTGSTGPAVTWDYQDGMLDSFANSTSFNWWGFKRAPGFFDVVTYEGQTNEFEVKHNLGVTPELILQKSRTRSDPWNSWFTGLTNQQTINLNGNNPIIEAGFDLWGTNPTVATDEVFRVGGLRFGTQATGVNGGAGQSHIAYLFASVPGISKVGTYTGTGSAHDIECGFTNGARFVMIKRLDSAGDWYVWDSQRGIVSGTEPYLYLNSNSAQVTGDDWIDPYAGGFHVSNQAGDGINASQNSPQYLFYAIA